MKRRGVLGLLGGAAVAGPSMAKQAVASGLEAMQVGDEAVWLATDPVALGSTLNGQISSIGFVATDPNSPTHPYQVALKKFLGMSDEEKQERRQSMTVTSLDPDLAANRSFSLSAKVSMQRDRDFARSMATQERYLRRQIADAMKHWAKRNLI